MATQPSSDGMAPRGLGVEVRGLTKRFGSVMAVRDLSFEARPGKVTGFLGPNGSGKTTTLRMLLGLVTPTAGTATIAGQRYRDLPDPLARVGAVLEATSFHPARRARAHLRMIALAGGIEEQRIDEVLDLVGLTGDAKRRVGGFSMGMRQRLTLAGAMLGNPDVLILDEPSNGLDPQGIAWLREFMRHLAGEGRTVLVSSHLLAEMAQTVDEVVIISQGQLRAQGPLATLAAQARPSMRVRTPEPDRLISVATSNGLGVRRIGPDLVIVDGAVPEHLGPLLAQHQIVLYELAPQATSLEEVFLSLTAGLGYGQVPYAGSAVGPAGPGDGYGHPAVPGDGYGYPTGPSAGYGQPGAPT